MDDSVFDELPRLRTARLVLRRVERDDVEMVMAFNSDAASLAHVPRDPFTEMEQAADWIAGFDKGYAERRGVWWTFTLGDTGEAIGYGGLFGIDHACRKAEIGYGLLPDRWGRGFGGEAAWAMTEFGIRSLGLHRIFGKVEPDNPASARILQKLGYRREGVLRHDAFARGRFFDMTVLALVDGD